MSKRHTTRVRHDKRSQVLNVRVLTPRTVWFGIRRFLAQSAKALCLLALLGGLGYGAWTGLRHVFMENDDFRLQAIDLKPNSALDERRLVEIAGIDLNSSLFKLDINRIEGKLMALPELTGAKVERHLPGTLQVTVSVRTPVAWVARAPIPETAAVPPTQMLADSQGIAYPCPRLQRESARSLPVIILNPTSPEPVPGKMIEAPEFHRCLRLINDALKTDPDATSWIASVGQPNAWSLLLVTRDNMRATFGLGDHPRQLADLISARDHADGQGYRIDSINLIPERNIPVTITQTAPPRAIPVTPPKQEPPAKSRHQSDLRSLLDRG
jgi:hypothetical protein